MPASNLITLDISHLSQGVFYVQVEDENGLIKVKPLIKQ